jgi:integrase
MRCAGDGAHGLRTRALIVLLWRAGLRISEALALAESDLDIARGGRSRATGQARKRREVGMDRWGWQQLEPWLQRRLELPIGALLCIVDGQPPAGPGHRPRSARRSDSSPPPQRYADALHGINCATRTPSRWPAKGCRSTSSNGGSGTPTSA